MAAYGTKGSFSRTLSGRLNRSNWPGRGVEGAPHVASNIQVPSSGTRMTGGAGSRPNLTRPIDRPSSERIGTQAPMGTSNTASFSTFQRGAGYKFYPS